MPVKRHPVAVTERRDHLAQFPLDTALIGRLRATYERVRARDVRLAQVFYAKLFGVAPHIRPLFRSEPQAQAQKLMAALDAVVRNLEHPAENTEMLTQLGKRHAQYGARPEHYGLVIDVLIDSMQEVLEVGADTAALAEWRLALRLISAQMIASVEGKSSSVGTSTPEHD